MRPREKIIIDVLLNDVGRTERGRFRFSFFLSYLYELHDRVFFASTSNNIT